MFIYSSIVQSGLRVQQGRLDTSAHNIANARTPGYKALVAEGAELPGGGVELQLSRDPSAGPWRPDSGVTVDGDGLYGPDGQLAGSPPPGFVEDSNVDLAKEMVDLSLARHGTEALLAVYRTGDEMVGSLLETFA